MFTSILDMVGNTPMIHMEIKKNVQLFVKLEFYNPTGSVKDRAASYVLTKGLAEGIITRDSTIIESSSGNFGVALSAFSRYYGLKFICVIDKNTSLLNESIIAAYGTEIIKITEPDKYGGYLLNRIERIKAMIQNRPDMYWVNQYENPLNAEAYYTSLGSELCREAPGGKIDYVFIGVSSGGTITGVSRKIKEVFPDAKVIAVDIFGSIIFGDTPTKRYIPGIGSSMRPKILSRAIIDDVVWVTEVETVESCRELLKDHFLHTGGSSGSVYAGVRKYFALRKIMQPVNVLCIFPDKGERYMTTVYNEAWFQELKEKQTSYALSE